MSDSKVQVAPDGAGKSIQTHANDLGAGEVHAQAVVLTNPDGTVKTTVAVSDGGGSLTVDGSVTVGGTVAVSNLPATQPVSGPLTDGQLRASPVHVTDGGGSLTVDGTVAVSGTVPVSAAALPLPAGAAAEATLAAMSAKLPSALVSDRMKVDGSGVTQPVSGTVNVGNFPGTQPVSGTVTVTPPALTKATQGATGFSVQDLKDAGRTAFSLTAIGFAGVTGEALLSMTPVRSGVAGSAGTSHGVTAQKRLRLTAIIVSVRTGAAAANWGRFVLRTNPSGAVATNSPALLVVECSAQAAVAGSGNMVAIPIPDGYEFAGTEQIGITHIGAATTNVNSVTLLGYEY